MAATASLNVGGRTEHILNKSVGIIFRPGSDRPSGHN